MEKITDCPNGYTMENISSKFGESPSELRKCTDYCDNCKIVDGLYICKYIIERMG